MSGQNDHDILTTLVEQVKNLTSKVDENANRLEVQIKDLRENLANRLERVETSKLDAQDFINRIGTLLEDHKTYEADLEALKNQHIYWKAVIKVVVIVSGVLFSIIGFFLERLLSKIHL